MFKTYFRIDLSLVDGMCRNKIVDLEKLSRNKEVYLVSPTTEEGSITEVYIRHQILSFFNYHMSMRLFSLLFIIRGKAKIATFEVEQLHR